MSDLFARARRFAVVGLLLTGAFSAVAAVPATATPTAAVCPGVGPATGCGVLVTINSDGSIVVTQPGNGNPYDATGDTVIGVVNDARAPLSSIALAGSGIFDFDGHGICTQTPFTPPSAGDYCAKVPSIGVITTAVGDLISTTPTIASALVGIETAFVTGNTPSMTAQFSTLAATFENLGLLFTTSPTSSPEATAFNTLSAVFGGLGNACATVAANASALGAFSTALLGQIVHLIGELNSASATIGPVLQSLEAQLANVVGIEGIQMQFNSLNTVFTDLGSLLTSSAAASAAATTTSLTNILGTLGDYQGIGNLPIDATSYEGPDNTFNVTDPDTGTVNFTLPIVSGSSTFFSLPGALGCGDGETPCISVRPGRLTIRGTDSGGKPLVGGTYSVFGDATPHAGQALATCAITTLDTSGDATCTAAGLSNLPAGQYFIDQMKAPAGYRVAAETAVIVSGATTATIVDDPVSVPPTTPGGSATTPPVDVVAGATTTPPTNVVAGTTTPPTNVVGGATTVHTGEWFAGSQPFLLPVFAAGLGLLGLGRIGRRSARARHLRRS